MHMCGLFCEYFHTYSLFVWFWHCHFYTFVSLVVHLQYMYYNVYAHSQESIMCSYTKINVNVEGEGNASGCVLGPAWNEV